jgi:hypothetical protein
MPTTSDHTVTPSARYFVRLRDRGGSASKAGSAAQRFALGNPGTVVHTPSAEGFAVDLPATPTADQLAKLRADGAIESIQPAAAANAGPCTALSLLFQPSPCGACAATPPPDGGTGVDLYVVDTGVNSGPFNGRISAGLPLDGSTDDEDGHGTEIAAAAAGAGVGVAPGATVIPVRVQSGKLTGQPSEVAKGLNWVTQQAQIRKRPAVALISQSGPIDANLDSAVAAAIAAGVTCVVAAGNTSSCACGVSPARVPQAITVGAVMTSGCTYLRWVTTDPIQGSNSGSLVRLYAPGQSVWTFDAQGALVMRDGTSISAALVAGIAALYLEGNNNASPAQVAAALVAAAIPGLITDIPGGRLASALV